MAVSEVRILPLSAIPAEVLQAAPHRENVSEPTRHQLETVVSNFVQWLGRYGETSYDFQTFYASRPGRLAKRLYYRNRYLGTLAVSPIIFCEAFAPSTRRFFFVRQRFPIADAHFA